MWTRCTYEQHERLCAARQALLGSLTRRNQAGVHRVVVEVLFHDRLAFFDDPGGGCSDCRGTVPSSA